MNNTTILKLINLLNENKKQEIKEILTKELLKQEYKKKASLFTAVQSYIKKMDNTRPKLKAIQNRNGKQYILNGLSLFVFDDYKQELEALPQETENTLPYENILYKDKMQTELTQDDIFVLQNLKKFISWSKAQDGYTKGQTIMILFDNKIFNAKILAKVYDICDHDFDTWKKCITTEKISGTQISTKDMTVFILPLRDTTQQNLFDATTEIIKKFKKELNGDEE